MPGVLVSVGGCPKVAWSGGRCNGSPWASSALASGGPAVGVSAAARPGRQAVKGPPHRRVLQEDAVLAEEGHTMTDLKDLTGLAAQVQGLMNGYLKLRDEKVQLEAELSTRREDIRRLEKLVASQNAEIDKLKK
jgi:hypothetical protein